MRPLVAPAPVVAIPAQPVYVGLQHHREHVLVNCSVSIGIYNYRSRWSTWLDPPGGSRTDGPPVNQQDVEAYYIGSNWCAKRFVSANNADFIEKPVVWGPTKVDASEWAFNRVYAYQDVNGQWTCNY